MHYAIYVTFSQMNGRLVFQYEDLVSEEYTSRNSNHLCFVLILIPCKQYEKLR